jgi:hypothetical protein
VAHRLWAAFTAAAYISIYVSMYQCIYVSMYPCIYLCINVSILSIYVLMYLFYVSVDR